VNLQKPFFVGQRSLEILKRRGPRQVLVGFELPADAPLPKECHLVIDQGEIAGRLTSVARSATLNKIIGMAMVAPHLARAGGAIEIRADVGALLRAAIVPTPFYDPQNSRQRAAVAA
jgi:sarcosine oxidase subunit alpha